MGGSTSHQKQHAELDACFSSQYKLGALIGQGAFGQVYQVRPTSGPQRTGAVKITWKDGDQQDFWSEQAVFYREIAILQCLEHDNVLMFWGSFIDSTKLYLVTELCAGGEVFEKLVRRNRFFETDAAAILTQMLLAIEYIHSQSVMHRDIKTENFMFSDPSPDSTVKLIDFGMSSWFRDGETFHDVCGSRFSYAPEMLERTYDHRIDMWAFGVMTYLMCRGRYPFDVKSKKEAKISDLCVPLTWSQRVPLSPETQDFIQRILQVNPDERLTAKEALIHPFIGYRGQVGYPEQEVNNLEEVDNPEFPPQGSRQATLNSDLSETVKQAHAVVRATKDDTVTTSKSFPQMKRTHAAAKELAWRTSKLMRKAFGLKTQEPGLEEPADAMEHNSKSIAESSLVSGMGASRQAPGLGGPRHITEQDSITDHLMLREPKSSPSGASCASSSRPITEQGSLHGSLLHPSPPACPSSSKVVTRELPPLAPMPVMPGLPGACD